MIVKKKVLLVCSPYYKDITTNLIKGATDLLEFKSVDYNILNVPGALEIAPAIKLVLDKSLKELRAQEKQIVQVTFDYRVEPVALERIKNAVTVKNIFEFQYEIEFDTVDDRRPLVFDFAHDNGLKILALQHKSKNLEERFNELTSR